MIEDRGRIERGAALGIVGGCARTCGSSNFSAEPWSEVIDTWRGNVRDDMVLEERVNDLVFLKSMTLLVGPAMSAEWRRQLLSQGN
jgi:hypothetical protein